MRRTLEELKSRYALEPELRDTYVEGAFDREVLSQCSDGSNNPRVFYEIDTVDVPNEIVIRHGMSEGNKQRVIALARELSLLDEPVQYRCIVDRDLDHWFGPLADVPRLVWTEYCSLEAYFLDEQYLQNQIVVVAKARIKNWKLFYASLLEYLRIRFIMRLADRNLNLCLSWVSIAKYVSVKDSALVFERERYQRATLLHSKKGAFVTDFAAEVARWEKQVDGDHRYCMHGHDFVEAIATSLNHFAAIDGFASVEVMERLLIQRAATHSPLFDLVH